jgi:hypothetical protein
MQSSGLNKAGSTASLACINEYQKKSKVYKGATQKIVTNNMKKPSYHTVKYGVKANFFLRHAFLSWQAFATWLKYSHHTLITSLCKH